MADQEWKFDTFDGISDDFWTKWAASQRISVVKSYVRSGVPLNLIHILPQLHYLSHLTLASNENLALILAFAAQSTRLNELVINIFPWTAHELITAQMANDVIEWFHRQPVRVFQFSNWNLVDLDATLKQLFYQVVFTCPTLEELSIYNTKLDDVDFSGMALSMKSLTLSKCRLDPTFEEFLKSQGIPHLFVFHD
ncbi:hypothetical protein AeMF1_013693 [Aphanomyces euteiches]|nr:hypothetical protein AeMF1_013693 [Aphanomyces euteiches]KAH9183442.1 hypothetical protein AeNC1_014582 [Aphanomyces euteiches]